VLEQDLVHPTGFSCVAGETYQLAFREDLRPERCPSSLDSMSALLSLFKALFMRL